MSPRQTELMGLLLHNLHREVIIEQVLGAVQENRKMLLVNANAHMMVLAQNQPWIRALFCKADIAFCDGAGVQLAHFVLKGRPMHRTTPPEWVVPILQSLGKDASIFWIGGKASVVEAAARRYEEKFGVRTAGVQHGYFDHAVGSEDNRALVKRINEARPTIILVNMGMPRQERWIADHFDQIDRGIVISAGALVDHAAGIVHRPPLWVSNLGLEWAVRLSREPRRLWRRYLFGLPLFGFYIFAAPFNSRRKSLASFDGGPPMPENAADDSLIGYQPDLKVHQVITQHSQDSAAPFSSRKIFGFRVSPFTAQDIVQMIIKRRRTEEQGVGIVVTANLDHIVKMQKNADFAAAYSAADIITCDGFPVFYFARLRGIKTRGRVTGTEITELLLREHEAVRAHKLFFVADSDETVKGLTEWADSIGLRPDMIAFTVPPFGFERDPKLCAQLAQDVSQHGTSILLMGVGAPKSEIFLNDYRHLLPPCWSLCVGISLRIQAGLMRRAPKIVQQAHLEWAWRLGCEPKRLAGRYVAGSVLFTYLAIRELLAPESA